MAVCSRRLLHAASMMMCVAVLLLVSGRAHSQAVPETEGPRGVISRLRLGEPRTEGALTIVPIRLDSGLKGNVQTLAEALQAKSLVVQEIGEGRVNEICLDNRGAEPVFIMAGQILVGARQNRILQRDLLLPPKSGPVQVQAFCVQHGRWQYEGGTTTFASSANVSNPAVRAAAGQTKAQGEVWGAVAKTQDLAHAPNATANLDEVYKAPAVQAHIQAVSKAFERLPERYPDMCGAVAIVNGRVLAVDLFGQRRLFRNLWSPLLASYALEAGKSKASDASGARLLVKSFLDSAAAGSWVRVSTPGSGRLLELTGTGPSGTALLDGAGVIHLELFPRTAATPKPPHINEPPIIRPFNR